MANFIFPPGSTLFLSQDAPILIIISLVIEKKVKNKVKWPFMATFGLKNGQFYIPTIEPHALPHYNSICSQCENSPKKGFKMAKMASFGYFWP